MIVNLPPTTLKDACSATRASIADRHSKFFSKTPSIKQLFDTVRQQPRIKPARRTSKDPIKPEDEAAIIQAVDLDAPSQPSSDHKQVIKTIAGHLVSLLDEKVKLPEFEGHQTPSISIHDYVDRLIRYVDAWAGEKPHLASTGVSAALMAIEYLDRLNTGVSSKNVHRLYMCAVLVAVKFVEDFTISNRFWAKVAGIDLQDMNRMELAFCNMLSWRLQISREDFESQQMRFSEPVF